MYLKAPYRSIASFVGAVLLAGLLVVPSFWVFTQIKDAARERRQAYEVIVRAESLLSALSDAETGERGFALTGDKAFLEPYVAVQDDILGKLADLRRRTRIGAAQQHLDAMTPLVEAKLAEMSRVIELRRNHDTPAMLALVASGQGKRLMDAIRREMKGFIQLEDGAVALQESGFQSHMGALFTMIVIISFFTVLVAFAFVYVMHRQTQQRIRNQVHLETQHLLGLQEDTNDRLHATNLTLQESEEKLSVTLDSIGDAVIATDTQGRVKLMNPVAAKLTGWTLPEALDQPIDAIFQIINQETRRPSVTPVLETLVHGTIQGLANHTLLIARDGSECAIADSCAPIRDREGRVDGAVLVFRDVTREYAVQRALADSSALVQAILRTVADGVITLQAQGGIIESVNPAAERMFGYTSAELIGQPLKRIIPELDRGQQDSSLEYYSASEASRASGLGREVEGRCKSGRTFPLEITVSDMLMGGQRYFTGILRDISQRKQAEDAFLKAGALQAAIFNSANFSSIATDAEGVIQIFNVGAERMLGYLAGEVMNKITPADISDPQEVIARAKALSLELETPIRPGFEALVFKASRGIEDIYELTYVRKDGRRVPALVSVTALRDAQDVIIGYLLIGTDNTARKQAEEALIQAGALQKAIFNSANFSSIATDAKGVIQIFNVGAERMLGYAASDVMNKITPADISDPEEVILRAKALSEELGTKIAPGFEALVFKASRGIEDIYELTYVRKDGRRVPALVSVTALRDAREAIIGYLLIGTDNTARKAVEDERSLLNLALQDKNTELMGAKISADKANLAKSEFLSSMSHELRSPLNAILGFAQLMDSQSPPLLPQQKSSIDQILHAGWYLLELINEILDLTVIESGKLSLSEEPVSLGDVLMDCQAMIEPQGLKRGLKMAFPVFGSAVFIRADRVRLKQVLINILSNAIKYNRPGGSVVVDWAPGALGRIRIGVRDTGQGLSPDKLRQLFQPFNRLGQENSAEEGTGIGLVMSKLLVELMGGTIGVESKVGQGSQFWFELNLAEAPRLEQGGAKPHAVGNITVQPDASIQTLLYVEDNPANLSLVEQLMARRPHIRLLGAENGSLGIELAKHEQPDLILMDINLPGMSGLQAMKILKADPLTAHIPVVAISANAMLGDIQKGLDAGFVKYLTKPIIVAEFMETIDQAMASAKLSAAGNQ